MARYASTKTGWDFWRLAGEPGCWEWKGAKDRDGYGQTRVGMTRVKAHRKAWEIVGGPIPDGLLVLHKCNNPACVRPDHLYLGTPLDNGIDRRARGRPRRGNYRFSPAEIEDIRTRYATGTVKQQDLADEYGTQQATISRIVLLKSYRSDLPVRGNAIRRME